MSDCLFICQDWLSTEFEDMSATTQNAMVGKTWMNTMGAGTSMNDLPIQFCMPMPRHLLQSVEMPTVTQVTGRFKIYLMLMFFISKITFFALFEATR